jgi:hypothetical protein
MEERRREMDATVFLALTTWELRILSLRYSTYGDCRHGATNECD